MTDDDWTILASLTELKPLRELPIRVASGVCISTKQSISTPIPKDVSYCLCMGDGN
jgi:hypothetical protein